MAWVGTLGSGTEDDPYLIIEEQELWDYWNDPGYTWARLTRDLDMAGIPALITPSANRSSVRIDGAGHSVRNATFADDPFADNGAGTCYFRNVEFYILAGWITHTYYYDGINCTNVRWHYEHVSEVQIYHTEKPDRCYFTDCMVSGACTFIGANTQTSRTNGFYVLCSTTDDVRTAGYYQVLTAEESAQASSYDLLDPAGWVIEDGTVPYPQQVSYDYSQFTRIKGVTTVDSIPESRMVRIHTARYPGYVAGGLSTDDGTFEFQTRPFTEPLLVIAHDDIGLEMRPTTDYELGDIVHPAGGNGYRYLCIQAGTTADPLPQAPWPTDQLTSGTAIFEARKIRQPIVEGPVTPAPYIPPSE